MSIFLNLILRKNFNFSKFNLDGIDAIKHFSEFEEQFTAPIHGFKNADDFYQKASAKNYLKGIKIPALIVNAIKYGKEDGSVQVGFFDMDENILIEVADDGGGIPSDHLPRLFERFYRVDKSRSRSEGGTGLGLSIVKHIIEAHRQTINVRSTENVGTTFSFTLKKSK